MKKKIQIIIKEEKESLINVSRGYAFNYLIPKKNGEIPTKKRIKHIQMFTTIKKEKEKLNEIKIQQIRENIKKINKISIYKKIGENKLIFGSITEKEIFKWILKHTDLSIEKIQIKIPDIKIIGTTNLDIQIKPSINETLTINIIPINI